MRSKLAVLLIVVFCITLAARADDATKMAKIHEFFKVAHIDQLTDQTRKQVIAQTKSSMMQQALGIKLNASQQQKIDDFTDKLSAIVSSSLNWEKIEPEMARLYADNYTEQQIDDLLAFYKSPTGQVVVEKTPLLMQQSNAIAQKHLEDAIPQIQELLRDFMQPAVSTP